MPLHLLQIAKKLAHDAGRMAMEYQARGFKTHTKGALTDLVTEADYACEELILKTIRSNFPDHSILSEERGAIEGSSEYKWIIDPIDGTTNFAHGSPFFSISIALVHAGKPIIGVVEVPALGETFWAKQGDGAYLNRKPIVVSDVNELAKAVLVTGFPYDRESPRWAKSWEMLQEFHKNIQGIRRTGSACLDLAFIAAGRFDGFYEYGLQPWDVAAGKIIVEEAGGEVTNMDGTPLNPKREQIVASNGHIHGEMLGVIKRCGGDQF